jgi:glucose-6-phosphate isomerase, archaeal
MALMEPFSTTLDLRTGLLTPAGERIQRRLSDMRDMYADDEAIGRILHEEGDRLIYEVYIVDLPQEVGHVLHCTTVIHPGRIGEEYHMTKGHFHAVRDRAEIYVGLTGRGMLLLMDDEGTVCDIPMEEGTVAYIPPLWAHRTANIGNQPFTFFSAWPGDAGHDYGTIEEMGFAKLLVERNGRAALIPNPRYRWPRRTTTRS